VIGQRRSWLNRIARHVLSTRPRSANNFGALWRVSPISRTFGFDRGQPVDRWYIERFLTAHALDIRGDVLEIGDNTYTLKFGRDRVTKSEVLHVAAGHSGATIQADLTHGGMSEDTFDCVICTQTLQFIYGVRMAMGTLHRLLKPGGVLLMTVPGISQISRFDMDRWGEYWRFTTLSTRRLCEEVFPPANVSVEAHGNVLTAIAFLHGLASEELTQEELDHHDADYELLITARMVK